MKSKILILLLILATVGSCKKSSSSSTTTPPTALEKYFETELLNRIFIVNYATNNGVDITSDYNGYTFKLLKTDYYHGPAEIVNGSNTYSGSWASNSDYSKLTITLPSSPAPFLFLTRDWKFTSKALPQLKLAPWFGDPYVLWMLRQ